MHRSYRVIIQLTETVLWWFDDDDAAGGVLLPFASGFAFPENLFQIFRAGTSDVR